MTISLEQTIRDHLATPSSGWAIGAFGAIAEFIRDPVECLAAQGPLVVATERGAISIHVPAGVQPVAYESVSAHPDRWLHGVAFCLSESAARMNVRRTLTEVGPDAESILERDRQAILFDIGTGSANVDAFVRTDDPTLIALLRRYAGLNALAAPEIMAAIVAANPHRVFVSRMGRIEVRQRIGSRDADPPTPEGPHTHVLPNVLSKGRTHSANLPIPAGTVPCLNLYPANPTFDMLGRPRAFDDAAFARFQTLLEAWGVPSAIDAKRSALEALGAGLEPATFRAPDRIGRAAVRVALRQAIRREGESARLAEWRAVHDGSTYRPDDHHPYH